MRVTKEAVIQAASDIADTDGLNKVYLKVMSIFHGYSSLEIGKAPMNPEEAIK